MGKFQLLLVFLTCTCGAVWIWATAQLWLTALWISPWAVLTLVFGLHPATQAGLAVLTSQTQKATLLTSLNTSSAWVTWVLPCLTPALWVLKRNSCLRWLTATQDR